MDRLNYDQTRVEQVRTDVQNVSTYAGKSTPLPGTALKLDDDVMWLDFLPLRVVWGYETSDFFFGYNPEVDIDAATYYDGIYITDRAPADSQETPMPIYPQQAQQPQGNRKKHDPKRALQDLLKRLSPEAAKHVRELARAKRSELLDKDG